MRFPVLILCLFSFPFSAQAQLVLPGAVTAPPPGVVTLPGHSKPAKPKVVYSKIAGEDSVVGRSLMLNGRAGALEFGKIANQLSLSKLTLAGNKISRPGDSCQVQIISTEAAPLTLVGKPDGVLRYHNAASACSFSIDILQGAVIVKSEAEICTFQAADCQARPSGMWGPAGNSISESQIKNDITDRTQAETAMRASFRALMEKHSDRASTKLVAREQAAFSSQREEMCRGYDQEDKHGFCDARYTEAEVSNLRMRLDENSENGVLAPVKMHKRKRAAPQAAPEQGGPLPLF